MPFLNTAADAARTEQTPRQDTFLSCRLDAADALPGPPITVLHLAGEIDLSTRPLARTALRTGLHTATDPVASAAGQVPGALVIDVADLGFCGATALTQLTEAAQAATDAGAGYALAGPNPHLQRLTALLASGKQIDAYPNLTAAVRALHRHRAAHDHRAAREHHAPSPHRAPSPYRAAAARP